MQPQVTDFIEKNKEYFLEELKKILRIPSVSAQSDKKPEVLRCAKAEAEKLKAIGLENVRLVETKGNPLVYGDWLHAKGKPTFWIYGHYDVQPPDPLDQWKSPPFEPTIRDGNLYARGANDNKGQHFSHICALEAYLKTVGKLPVNVKVIFEGEEEVGSVGLEDIAHRQKDLLACDAILVSDTPWLDPNHPSLILSLKGLAAFEVKMKSAAFDLHSGLYGGMVRNPCQALSWVLSKLKDENERILIPGWYDDVVELSAEDRKDIKALPFDEKGTAREVGASTLINEKGYSSLETNGGRPTLDINGIYGGYQGEGPKTIIPAEATAKITMRLVAKQDPAKLQKLFKEYVESLCPQGCAVEVKSFHSAPALLVDKSHPFVRTTMKAYSEGFGKQVVFKREGASIPIMKTLETVLKVPILMIGIGLLDDAIHSPNEKLSLSNFYGGIRGAALAYEALAEQNL